MSDSLCIHLLSMHVIFLGVFAQLYDIVPVLIFVNFDG